MIESKDKKQTETATVPGPGDFPLGSPESRAAARLRLQGVGEDSRECICFPEDENPFFLTPEEEEAAARAKCPLHGERFRHSPHLFVPGWRYERELIRRQKYASPQYRKALAASFLPNL